jgi:hypothetical protein
MTFLGDDHVPGARNRQELRDPLDDGDDDGFENGQRMEG